MKNNRWILLSILVICLLSISVANAAEDMAKDIVGADNDQELILDENINEEPENADENTTSEKVEVFNESEQNDINQILNILE